jgi:hypothetical protein
MEMTTEYEEQHALWQIDDDNIMKEMKAIQELAEKYPYGIKVSMDNNYWFERWYWCGEHFECETYCYEYGYFQFKHEEDAVFFALKWGVND